MNLAFQSLLLHDYVNVIKRQRWVILTFFVAVVLTIAIFTLRKPRLYRATAVIEIGSETPDVAFFKEVVSVNPTNWWSIGRYYETQYKIITMPSTLSLASRRIIEKKILSPVKGASDTQAYVSRLAGGLSVEPIGDSRLVGITLNDVDQEKIADMVNTVAEVYVEENLNQKLVGAKQAVDWLSQQMKTFQQEKSSSELELQEFREKYKIVSMENPREMMEANLKSLTESLNDLSRERIRLEARFIEMDRLIKSTKGTDDLFGLVESDILKKLKTDYIDQERKYSVLSVRYKNLHPEMVRAKRELDELRKKIALEVTNELQRMKSRYLLSKAEEDRIREELESKKLDTLEFDRVNYQLQNIVRTADTNQKLFSALSEKLKEADLSGLVKSNNILIRDLAVRPGTHFSPHLGTNMILAILIGLIGGLILAFGWEYLDATFRSQSDVQAIFNAPFLGIVPLVSERENGKSLPAEGKEESLPQRIEYVPVHSPNSAVAEMYRNIRTNLSFATSVNSEKVLVVTSTSPQEGKTATSLNLSITLAQLGQRVLLVDTDMRRPSIHRMFELEDKHGFSSLLINSITIDEATHKTHIENLDIIPAGPIPPNPAELLSTPTLGKIFTELRKRYDKIIVDACPIIPISDTLLVSQQSDGVIFVVRAEGPHKNIVMKAKVLLENSKANIVGCILNGVAHDRMEMADRYYYRYGYYRYRQGQGTADPTTTNV